ncbi:MAG: hypothetical protein UY44_C0004G0029 [Candidatus Kaiserbacteria bacterium GW2011_GWA2_49_19]|uniref:L-threonylcarbamoyladenylate synthase n=1 Tax=Candidatus Kaiserbacteria bacterium GW2011_GWA2_49_19 TaxID=1618669 RepID=A0A0G1YSF6_9BACT|nr:MAG: hypothetical protein UY44_C0004G0029 [Candidatus Kaiserbacteria bacterium GW2011_GWA2_49_19]
MKILTECNLAQIVVELLNGKTVVFPTETSYGLGCDATNQEAVDRIFKIKERRGDKPLLVVVPTVAMAKKYLVWNNLLEKIASKYWPGAVTVVGSYSTPPFKEGIEGWSRVSGKRLLGFIRTIGMRSELRKNKTKAEKILWSQLRLKRLGGLRFRRQHGIGPYVVDFYQADSKIVIEVDGDVHFSLAEQEIKDRVRQRWLEGHGYIVLRYNNVDVFNNLDGILREIYHMVTAARPHPALPLKGEVALLARGVVSLDNTVAIRVTAHPFLKSITEKLGRPLVATSANAAGGGDCYSAAAAVAAFQNRAEQPDIILDYGALPKRPPTTVVSAAGGVFKVLRQGERQIAL